MRFIGHGSLEQAIYIRMLYMCIRAHACMDVKSKGLRGHYRYESEKMLYAEVALYGIIVLRKRLARLIGVFRVRDYRRSSLIGVISISSDYTVSYFHLLFIQRIRCLRNHDLKVANIL